MGSYFLFVFALLGVAGILFWRWRKKIDAELAEGAGIEWDLFQEREPEFLGPLTRERFNAVFARVHTPRFPGYAFAAMATFFLSLPVTLALLTAILLGAERFGVTPEPIEVADKIYLRGDDITVLGKTLDEQTRREMALHYASDLAGFYYFFGVLVMWGVIVAVFTRRFHARRPGFLRDEIILARETAKGT